MSAHRARHSTSGGGRSVNEILARVTSSPASVAAIPSQRSTFTIASAAAVGAGAAAATVTGTFPAIPAPSLPGIDDTHPVARIIEPVASGTPSAAPAIHTAAVIPAPRPAPLTEAVAGAPRSGSGSGVVSASTARSGATGGTVMATDLHQSNATEIAALSRAVDLNRAAAPTPVPASVPAASPGQPVTSALQSITAPVGSVVDAALSLPSKIGGVPIAGLAGSKSAATALRNAATKLGKPYVWGAVGPSSFDCSGLMMWAYKQAGVTIPRTSAVQAKFGTPVAVKDLKPGDMVFYYSPVSHVGMYIGDGKILHASEAGQPIKISKVNAFPIHNARRIIA